MITGHLGLSESTEFGDDEKYLVYCEFKKLQNIRLEQAESKYRVVDVSEGVASGAGSRSQTSVDLNGNVRSVFSGTLMPSIVKHMGLKAESPLSDADKLSVYNEYNKLGAVTLVPLVTKYQFTYRSYIGLVSPTGQVQVLKVFQGGSSCPK